MVIRTMTLQEKRQRNHITMITVNITKDKKKQKKGKEIQSQRKKRNEEVPHIHKKAGQEAEAVNRKRKSTNIKRNTKKIDIDENYSI